MKHVSFALRLSYETCFVNRKFIDFLDFVMATAVPTANLDSFIQKIPQIKRQPHRVEVLQGCLYLSVLSILWYHLSLHSPEAI